MFLLRADPGKSRKEAGEMLTAAPGTAERRRIMDIEDEQAYASVTTFAMVLVNGHREEPPLLRGHDRL
jgi:hypothetical protein